MYPLSSTTGGYCYTRAPSTRSNTLNTEQDVVNFASLTTHWVNKSKHNTLPGNATPLSINFFQMVLDGVVDFTGRKDFDFHPHSFRYVPNTDA
jgi:hypothetical protein